VGHFRIREQSKKLNDEPMLFVGVNRLRWIIDWSEMRELMKYLDERLNNNLGFVFS
jgi:hypothetical protein